MKVLILHGIGGHAGIHWQQWLSDELTKKSYEVVMPNLSKSEHPSRKEWLDEVINVVGDSDTKKLIIVAHSLGVATALDYIEQCKDKVKALVAVSGFAAGYGAELNSYYMKEKSLDFNEINPNLGSSFVIYGDNDPYVTQAALKQVADELNVQPIIVHMGGHLNSEAGFTKFPQLLDIVEHI